MWALLRKVDTQINDGIQRIVPAQQIYEWEVAAYWQDPVGFKTSTFNSRFNTAYYNNPNFHPEEWTETESAGDLSPRRE
jgi:hypothetical protein